MIEVQCKNGIIAQNVCNFVAFVWEFATKKYEIFLKILLTWALIGSQVMFDIEKQRGLLVSANMALLPVYHLL